MAKNKYFPDGSAEGPGAPEQVAALYGAPDAIAALLGANAGKGGTSPFEVLMGNYITMSAQVVTMAQTLCGLAWKASAESVAQTEETNAALRHAAQVEAGTIIKAAELEAEKIKFEAGVTVARGEEDEAREGPDLLTVAAGVVQDNLAVQHLAGEVIADRVFSMSKGDVDMARRWVKGIVQAIDKRFDAVNGNDNP